MKYNIQVVESTLRTVFNIMNRKIYPVPRTFLSCVYDITFKFTDGTDSSNIGMINRRLFERLKEHQKDVKYNNLSTALSITYLKCSVSFIDFDNAKILLKQDHAIKAIMRESSNICLKSQSIYNDNSNLLSRVFKSVF